MSIFNFSAVAVVLAAAVALALSIAQAVSILIGTDTAPDTRLVDFDKKANTIQIISLGSSHSIGFHFPSFGVDGHSLFSDGQDIKTSEFKLRAIISRTPQLKCLLFPLSPGVLTYNMPQKGLHQQAALNYTPWPNSVAAFAPGEWFVFLRSKLVKRLLETRYLIEQHFLRPVNQASKSSPSACTLYHNDPSKADEDGIRHGYKQHPVRRECFAELAVKTSESFLRNSSSDPKVRFYNIEKLRKVAQHLESYNADLILVAVPLAKEYLSLVSFQEFQDLRHLRAALASEPNVSIYDFSKFFHDKIDQDNLYFFDDDHLTQAGAEVFSKALREEIPQCTG